MCAEKLMCVYVLRSMSVLRSRIAYMCAAKQKCVSTAKQKYVYVLRSRIMYMCAEKQECV